MIPENDVTGEPDIVPEPAGGAGTAPELAGIIYRLALIKASQRDLSGAVMLARHARVLNKSHENAAKLLEICLCELDGHSPETAEDNQKILVPVKLKKWRKAARFAGEAPHQSVRILNIRGCIYACAKRYGKAAREFSQALEKDKGNKLAAAGLAGALQCRIWRWP